MKESLPFGTSHFNVIVYFLDLELPSTVSTPTPQVFLSTNFNGRLCKHRYWILFALKYIIIYNILYIYYRIAFISTLTKIRYLVLYWICFNYLLKTHKEWSPVRKIKVLYVVFTQKTFKTLKAAWWLIIYYGKTFIFIFMSPFHKIDIYFIVVNIRKFQLI